MRNEYMTIETAAGYIGTSPKHVSDKIRKDPSFPKRKVGQRWMIPRHALDVWLDAHDPEKRRYECNRT